MRLLLGTACASGAIAIGEVQGPAAGLALVDELDLDNYHPYHATRADLLARLGRHSEAAAAYQRAAAMAPTDAERDFLRHGGRAARHGRHLAGDRLRRRFGPGSWFAERSVRSGNAASRATRFAERVNRRGTTLRCG